MTIKYDPQQVTDWLTPLEKVYARQSRQLDTYHQQLRERDRQEEEARIDLPEVFSKLAQFSSSISKIVDARETNISSKVKSTYDSANVDQKKIINQLVQERELDKTHTAFVQRVNAIDDNLLAPKYKQLLTSKNGGNVIRVRKLQGYEAIENFPNWIQNKIDNDSSFNADFERFKDDPAQLKTWYKSKLYERLGTSGEGENAGLGFADAFIATHFQSEVDRFADTKGTIAGLKSKNVVFAIDGETNAKIVNSSIYAFNAGQPNSIAQGAHTLILEGVNKNANVDLTKSTENTALFYTRLAKDGRFSNENLAALKSGEIEGHPSGKHGDILFSETQFKKIQQGINEYNANFLAAHTAQNVQGLNNVFTNFIQGKASEQDKAIALQTFKDNGGDVNSKEYKRLETSKRHNPVIAQIESERIEKINTTGRPGQYEDEVENMSQIDFEKWKEDKDLYEANREQNGFDKKTSDTFATNLLKADLGFDLSPLGKGLVPGTQTEIRDFISARRDEIYATVYNDPEQDRKTIGKTTDAILKDELTQMGLFASNDREDADYGILTSDGQGGFPGWEAVQQSKIERTKGTNPQRTVRNLINEFTEYKNLNGVLENGKGITNAELLAVVESIQDGKLTTFPPDILLKSRIFGIQPSTLIVSKLDYLENTQDKGDKDFVKRFGLDPKKLKEYIPSTDIEMREVLKGINDGRTLLNQYNRLGIGGFTPNQLNRIIKANEDYNTRKRIANDAVQALADK